MTAYHASMPKSAFSLWAFTASEMVLSPVMREFYQERDVVMEERRLRYDNSPHGILWEALVQEAYPEGPYSFSPIGTWKDLKSLTMEDAFQFHQQHYAPNNMVGALVGAIRPSEAQKVLEQFFGRVPARKLKKEKPSSSFAFQGEKRKAISFPAEPQLLIAFHKPKAPSREDYVFDILDSLLCEGRTGRLHKKLVQEEKTAASVYCTSSFPGSRYDNLFVILVTPIKSHSLKKLEDSVLKELSTLAANLEASELEKVRQAVSYQFFWGLEKNMELAEQLAIAEAILKDWRYVVNYPKVIQSISSEEIKRVVEKYFQPDNRVTIYRRRG
jgi:predicted Zn-dependent peptidase